MSKNRKIKDILWILWQWLIFTYNFIISPPKCPKCYCSRQHEPTKFLSTAISAFVLYHIALLRQCFCTVGRGVMEKKKIQEEKSEKKWKWFSLSKYECRFYKLFQAPKDFSESSLKCLCISKRLVKGLCIPSRKFKLSDSYSFFTKRSVVRAVLLQLSVQGITRGSC